MNRPVPGPDGQGPGPSGEFRLPKSSRLHKTSDIREVLRRGKRTKTSHLDVFFRLSPVSRSRLGLIVPKHRNRVVDRNRLKRRLRELGRTRVLPRLRAAGLAVDVLFRARQEAYGARFRDLKQEMMHATETVCSELSFSD